MRRGNAKLSCSVCGWPPAFAAAQQGNVCGRSRRTGTRRIVRSGLAAPGCCGGILRVGGINPAHGCLVTHEQSYETGRHIYVVNVGGLHFTLHSTRRVKRVTCDKIVRVVRLSGSVPVLAEYQPRAAYLYGDLYGQAEARQAAINLIYKLAHLFDGEGVR